MQNKILQRSPIGNPCRRWRQDHFILSNFSARANDMKNAILNCKEAGFNTVELGWAESWQCAEAVKYCEEFDLDLIYQNLDRYGGMQGYRRYKKNDLEGVINELKDKKHIIGYYIWDEPWYDDQLAESRSLVDECESKAPDKLPFTVAIPSYNTDYTWDNGKFAEYLEKYVTMIAPPVLSLDYYPIGMRECNDEAQLDRSRMWCDLGLMKKLGEKYDMPIWFYYQGQNLRKAKSFIFPMIRAIMYAGALYGAKGLQHFTAQGSIINEDGDKYIFFEDQRKIHEEFKNLGNTLMALTCKRVIHDSLVDPDCKEYASLHSTIADSAYIIGELPYRTSVAEFEDRYGNGYMMILNRDYMTSKTITLYLNGSYRLYEVSKTDGLQHMKADSISKIDVTLAPGDAVLYRLQNSSEEAFTIEYKLNK